MKIPSAVRQFNKHSLNHLTSKIARSAHGPFARIDHAGRRSGKPYQTTIIVVPMAGGFMIALTYGREVDWYRNVMAARHCRIEWHGQTFAIEQIEPAEMMMAIRLFSRPERLILRALGVQNFVRMTYRTSAADATL